MIHRVSTKMSEQRRASRHSESSAQKTGVTSVLDREHRLSVLDEKAVLDDQILQAIGYKQEFKR